MKQFKTISLFLMVCFFFSVFPIRFDQTDQVKAEDKNPLKIEKIIGLSKEPGTFRRISQEGWTFFPLYQQGLAVDSDGTIFIGDDGEGQIEVFGADLQPKYNFGSLGSGDGQFQRLVALMIDDKDQIYAVDSYLSRVQVFSKVGTFLRKFGIHGRKQDQFTCPTDISQFNPGEMIITDAMNGVKIYSSEGTYLRDFSPHNLLNTPTEWWPSRIEVSDSGTVYISLFSNSNGERNIIAAFDKEGTYIATVLDQSINEGLTETYLVDTEISGSFFFTVNINPSYTSVNRFEIPSDPSQPLTFFGTVAEHSEDYRNLSKTDVILPSAVFARDAKIYYLDGEINRLVVLTEKLDYIGTVQSPVLSTSYLYKALGKEIPLGYLENPQGIRVDSQGRIFVGNSQFSCVSVFDASGKPITNFGTRWMPDKSLKVSPGEFLFPTDIVFDTNGDILISDAGLNCVQIFDSTLKPKTILKPNFTSIGEVFKNPQGLAIDHNQNLLVVSSKDSSVSLLQKQSESEWKPDYLKKNFFNDQNWPVGIAVDADNNWVISFTGDDQIAVYDTITEKVRTIGESGEGPGQFNGPQGVLINKNGDIYVAETGNGRIQKFTPYGSLIWCQDLKWGGMTFIDQDASGRIYVTDCIHGLVLVLSETPNKPPEDEPEESETSFSLQQQKEEVKVGDTVMVHLQAEKLDNIASIEMTLKISKDTLYHNPLFHKITLSDFCVNQGASLKVNKVTDDTIELTITSKKNEIISGSGTLVSIEFKTTKQGLGEIKFNRLILTNRNGKTIHQYISKKDLWFTILENDSTPPPLKIEPIPDVVYDPILLIEGETEPGATVTINQKEVPVKEDGTFTTTVELIKGVNNLSIETTDKAGNRNSQMITITLKDRTIIQLTVGKNVMLVSGIPYKLDSEPFIDKASGRTMVPIRAISEAIGAEVKFDPKDQSITITLEPIIIVLWIGKPKALIDGVEVSIDPQ